MSASLLAVGLLASGCVRVHASLGVSASDLVSGSAIVAAQPTAGAPNTQLDIPTGMAGQVTTKPYAADGYQGSTVTFRNLTFTQVSALATSISNQSASYHIAFQRSGDLVTMAGSVDLSQLPASGVDVRLKVDFPGPVTTTNGTKHGQTVTWVMKAGTVTPFNATDNYALGNSHGWKFWSLALGGAIVLIAVFITGLALLARRHNLKKEHAYLAATSAG
jgi:hypothetical protein